MGANRSKALDFTKSHAQKKTSKDVFFNLVEPGGFEPPSASTPLSVLHA